MKVITAHNVNGAYDTAIRVMRRFGVRRDSRNGPVYEVPEPVTTCYINPTQRVLFNVKRDANPFFHLFESLWMLAGRNDVEFMSQFNSNIHKYSDDGIIFHGAYGHRWRKFFGYDQLVIIADQLRDKPDDRRAVLQMWDSAADLGEDGKDFPCNTEIYFKIRDGALQMTVCNRSNDILWGCYGANVVHMSMLHEYMAALIGVKVGLYHQMSDSWHAYIENMEKLVPDRYPRTIDYYGQQKVEPYHLVGMVSSFDQELLAWINGDKYNVWGNGFFPFVATPMLRAWEYYRSKRKEKALEAIELCQASDWRLACEQWLQRRKWNNDNVGINSKTGVSRAVHGA